MSWRTHVMRSGAVIQSGMNPRVVGAPRPTQPKLGLYRAIVLHTYATDAIERRDGFRRANTLRVVEVECDVLLASSYMRLSRVPVKQINHGLSNAHGVWVPKPCTRVIAADGSTDLTRSLHFDRVTRHGAPTPGPVPPLSDLDGDHVIVEFIEGDPGKPLITGALTHARARRLVIAGSGWDEADAGASRGKPHDSEYYVHHQGAEIRVNDRGDVLIDTVGAHADQEAENPATGGGQVRLRAKGTQRVTIEMDGQDVLEVWRDGAQVRIDLGEGASERLVLGDSFKTFFDAHVHPDPVGGTTGPPTVALPDSVLSDVTRTRKV